MRHLMLSAAICPALVVVSVSLVSAQPAPNGAALYRDNCASCHDAGADRAPDRDALRAMSAERVLAAMETGLMVTMASRNSTAERRAIAEFVTGKSFSQPLSTKPSAQAMCAAAPGAFTAVGRTDVERLGRQRRQHPVSGRPPPPGSRQPMSAA